MIHIDVCTDPADRDNDEVEFPSVLVQTSVDGGPWVTQYIIDAQASDIEAGEINLTDQPGTFAKDVQREDAKRIARVFANGCRFAGAEVRTTAFGYAL